MQVAEKSAKVTLNPRYNIPTKTPDVVVTYGDGGTNVKLTASTSSQSFAFSQRLGERNIVAPTIKSNRSIKLDWKCILDDDGINSVTTTYEPNSINVLWKDGPWKTNINAPLEGFTVDDVTVSVKRDLGFF